jgi:hypothetical protein
LKIVLANFNRFPVTICPSCKVPGVMPERRARDYVHRAKKRMLVERFLLARIYSDFENPDLFIFDDDAVIVGAAATASYEEGLVELSSARSGGRANIGRGTCQGYP